MRPCCPHQSQCPWRSGKSEDSGLRPQRAGRGASRPGGRCWWRRCGRWRTWWGYFWKREENYSWDRVTDIGWSKCVHFSNWHSNTYPFLDYNCVKMVAASLDQLPVLPRCKLFFADIKYFIKWKMIKNVNTAAVTSRGTKVWIRRSRDKGQSQRIL